MPRSQHVSVASTVSATRGPLFVVLPVESTSSIDNSRATMTYSKTAGGR